MSTNQCNSKKPQRKLTVKNWFFEEFNKIAKPLGKLNKKKEKRRHNSPMLAVKEGILDSTDIKRIVMEYYEQLYVNKFNNLNKMGKFPKKYNFSKFMKDKNTNSEYIY